MRAARKVTALRLGMLMSCGVGFPLTTALSIGACTSSPASPPAGCVSAAGVACPDADLSFDSALPAIGADGQSDGTTGSPPDSSPPGGDTGTSPDDTGTTSDASPAVDASDAGAITSINEWTWMSGSTLTLAPGVYGSLGDAGAANTPGARYGATSWTDSAGRLWLFGGTPADGIPMMNDLWMFQGTEWTWMGGSASTDALGVYALPDAGAGASFPGARYFTSFTTDKKGVLWLFGGKGWGTTATEGMLSDLWRFDGTKWTWVTGDTTVNVPPSYGDAGPLDPGGRNRGVSWVDLAGNFWVFGGRNNAGAILSDLWKFDGASWTWVGGSSTTGASGVYGVKGTPAAANFPGAREDSVSFTDASGNMWLYGGWGYDSAGLLSDLGDLWKFDGAQWTWVFGSKTGNGAASYGTPRVPAATNDPGGRENCAAGIDPLGGFWLFSGTSSHDSGELNDVWRYDGTNWTWVTGGSTPNAQGVYGQIGDAGGSLIFGGRDSASGWIDKNGNVWVFGGWGSGASATQNDLNDLWRYQP